MKISRPSLTMLLFTTATLALCSAGATAGPAAGLPLLAQQATAADAVPLNPRHPDKYVVKRGDTLWDISAMFLRDPWYWPEIWQVNPQVDNPHLIYPGDVLTLVYVNGKPQLRLERGMAAGTEKLSPRIREQRLDQAIPTIPREAIEAFLSKARVLEKDEIEALPYVVAMREGHMIGAAGNDLYVRGHDIGPVDQQYSVVHVADALRDPDDGDLVGYQALYVGDGAITRGGDPATLALKETQREALAGDRLVANDLNVPLEFAPRPPARSVDGTIMAVLDGVHQIAQYQVVVINRGARDGLEPGHVLTVWQTGEKVPDPHDSGLLPKKVRLPDERTGVSMVFRTYDRISYALIMEATSEIHVLDKVRNPS